MASLSDPARRESRGQLLLVAGVVIAILLLTVGIVFNTALYTEAKSTSTTFSDVSRATDLQDALRTDITTTIKTENEQMDGDADSDTRAMIENIDQFVADRQPRYAAQTTITHSSTEQGTRVEWVDSEQTFTHDGNGTWDVTTGIGRVRAYSLNVSTGSLATPTDTSPSTLRNESFGVTFSNETESSNQTAYVYATGGDTELRIVDDTDTVTATCAIASGSETTVDFTAKTLASDTERTYCRGLWPAFGVDTIRYMNGEHATGEFEYVYTEHDGLASITTAHSSIQTDSAAVYAMQLEYTYEASAVDYSTTTRIARGEP